MQAFVALMERELQTWLMIIFLALLIAVQLFIIAFLVRLSKVLKPVPGSPGLRDIAARIMETTEGVNRVAKTATQLLDQIRPAVDQVASVSRRHVAHADHVIDDVLNDVERVNQQFHNLAAAVSLPLREALALSAGIRSAAAMFFRRAGNSTKRKWC
jgi:uncharacterized protein YoxC